MRDARPKGGLITYQDLFSSVVAFLEALDAAVAVEVEVDAVAVELLSLESLLLSLLLVLVVPPDLQ